jgi:hypothetical protein
MQHADSESTFLLLEAAEASLHSLGCSASLSNRDPAASKWALRFENAVIAGEITVWKNHRFNMTVVITDPSHPLFPVDMSDSYYIDVEYSGESLTERMQELLSKIAVDWAR